MNIITWIKNKFGPETWTVFAEEEANIHVERFGFPWFTIPAVLIKEERQTILGMYGNNASSERNRIIKMKLTEEELKEFMKNNRPVDYGREDVDSSCNRWGSMIYEIDDKFYELSTLEGKPTHAYISNKGYADYYMLYEVKRIEVIEYYYEPVGEED